MLNFKDRLNELSLALIETQIYKSNKIKISLDEAINEVTEILIDVKNRKNNLFIIGNGGSSGIASHAANDFINMCNINTITFHDISVLTCQTNDFGYENAFMRLIENFSKPNDSLIAISSSGNSKNILNATKIFKSNFPNNKVVTLSGFSSSNQLQRMGDLNFWINSSSYGIVEISHQFILHFFADNLYKITNNE